MPNDLVVVWRVTERCNLSCPFCAYDQTLDRSRRDANIEEVLTFGKILQDVRNKRDVLVSWLGGEPFLWKPLLDVSYMFKHEFGLRVAVTTNGMVLKSKNIRERIVADFDQITISVDHVGIEHDQLRGAVGLFAGLKSNVRELIHLAKEKHSSLLVRVNIVLMRKTIHDFESLCNELADWGVDEVTFNLLGGRDRPEFFPANCLTENDVIWFAAELPRIREEMMRRGLLIQGSYAYLERMMTSARGEMFGVDDCLPGRQFLFVDESGIAAPCHFTVDGYGIPVHEVYSADDLEILPSILQARKQRIMLPPCLDCKSTQVFGKFNRQPMEILECQ
jgi:MoaA/NifB/PqqE/SkfB family radical SAM enzyme